MYSRSAYLICVCKFKKNNNNMSNENVCFPYRRVPISFYVCSRFLWPYSWQSDISVTLASTSFFYYYYYLASLPGFYCFFFIFFVLAPSYESCGNNAQYLSERVFIYKYSTSYTIITRFLDGNSCQ